MIILFIVTAIFLLMVFIISINSQFKKKKPEFHKPNRMDLTGIYKDINIEPYGCFSNLDEKFFAKKVNPFSKASVVDSGIVISELKANADTIELIQQVISNGFDQFGYNMINKYNGDYSKMNIKELAILGKLNGYNYISVYKLNENTRGTIYLTYSPPMDTQPELNETDYKKRLTKSENYTLTPKLNNFTNEIEKAPGKELSCGYTCSKNGKDPLTFKESGIEKNYMCGSVGFPDIKTPPRFAVYRIIEKN
jgi:hypothetical protein